MTKAEKPFLFIFMLSCPEMSFLSTKKRKIHKKGATIFFSFQIG
jgi:hypothetical protein